MFRIILISAWTVLVLFMLFLAIFWKSIGVLPHASLLRDYFLILCTATLIYALRRLRASGFDGR